MNIIPLANLRLSEKAKKSLTNMNINTLEELINISSEQLLEIKKQNEEVYKELSQLLITIFEKIIEKQNLHLINHLAVDSIGTDHTDKNILPESNSFSFKDNHLKVISQTISKKKEEDFSAFKSLSSLSPSIHLLINSLSLNTLNDFLNYSFNKLRKPANISKSALTMLGEFQDKLKCLTSSDANRRAKEEIEFFTYINDKTSVRTKNVLAHNNILTFKNLENSSEIEITNFRNVGAKTLQEIVALKKENPSMLASSSQSIYSSKQNIKSDFSIEYLSSEIVEKLNDNNISRVSQFQNLDNKNLIKFKLSEDDIHEIEIYRNLINNNKNDNIDLFKQIHQHPDKTIRDIISKHNLNSEEIEMHFFYKGKFVEHINVKEFNFTQRITNNINNLKINNIKVLAEYSYSDMLKKGKWSKSSLDKALIDIVSLIVIHKDEKWIVAHPSLIITQYYAAGVFNKSDIKDLKVINGILEKNYLNNALKIGRIDLIKYALTNYSKLHLALQSVELSESEMAMILKLYLMKQEEPRAFKKIQFDLQQVFNNFKIEKAIKLLKEYDILSDESGFYSLKPPSYKSFLNRINNERYKIILSKRFNGETLEAIGNYLKISRERIRQLEKKALAELPTQLFEDRYSYWFKTFNFTDEQFLEIFKISKQEYNYLFLRYDKGLRPFEEILNLSDIDIEIKKSVLAYCNKDFIIIDNYKIKKETKSIVLYLCKEFCQDKVHIEEIYDLYKTFLTEHNLDKIMTYRDERSIENLLVDSDKIVSNINRMLRYYNYSQYNWDEFYEQINLEENNDREISTLLIFTNYKELMDEYDIRDEYELHNVMKKTQGHTTIDIDFKRMPTLSIGKVDRENQVLEMLYELAPISYNEFVKSFCEKYGFKEETLKGNLNTFLNYIGKYLDNNIYSIEKPNIPPENLKLLEDICNGKDILFIDDIKKEFMRRSNEKLIVSTQMFNVVGYRVFSNYVISSKYKNAIDYFRHLFNEKDKVDLTGIDHKILYLSIFQSYLYKFFETQEFIEYEKNKYISMKLLESFNLGRGEIRNFYDQLNILMTNGKIYSVELLLEIMNLKFSEFGFEQRFYYSLIRGNKNFSSIIIGKSLLIRKNRKIKSIIDVLEEVLSEKKSIDIYELIDHLYSEYKIQTDKGFIVTRINESDMYYNEIMEKVYIDNDYYYEEFI